MQEQQVTIPLKNFVEFARTYQYLIQMLTQTTLVNDSLIPSERGRLKTDITEGMGRMARHYYARLLTYNQVIDTLGFLIKKYDPLVDESLNGR